MAAEAEPARPTLHLMTTEIVLGDQKVRVDPYALPPMRVGADGAPVAVRVGADGGSPFAASH